MKLLIFVNVVILICLHLTVIVVNGNIDPQRRVATIHQRMTAVRSSREGNPRPIAWENNKIPTIDRKIESLHRFRRVRKSVTAYPKHHLLQPIEVPLDEAAPKEGLNSTTAPYTDNHHSWKKTPVILQQV
ncbi:uncharacterized protein LOC129951094 [Eupeodes corollae]|uniref:uncharacterized protein LOC129951094 n=1 Tax=Eupeodes corollae TaxID=290404 RepID=UPI00249196CB|nr:uncharacterized protein LOC129951094 [Eupeodes corollae]